jgi:hypothetical protein
MGSHPFDGLRAGFATKATKGGKKDEDDRRRSIIANQSKPNRFRGEALRGGPPVWRPGQNGTFFVAAGGGCAAGGGDDEVTGSASRFCGAVTGFVADRVAGGEMGIWPALDFRRRRSCRCPRRRWDWGWPKGGGAVGVEARTAGALSAVCGEAFGQLSS